MKKPNSVVAPGLVLAVLSGVVFWFGTKEVGIALIAAVGAGLGWWIAALLRGRREREPASIRDE